jgi:hypothetical protein
MKGDPSLPFKLNGIHIVWAVCCEERKNATKSGLALSRVRKFRGFSRRDERLVQYRLQQRSALGLAGIRQNLQFVAQNGI